MQHAATLDSEFHIEKISYENVHKYYLEFSLIAFRTHAKQTEKFEIFLDLVFPLPIFYLFKQTTNVIII